jgi:hypothetical protein
MDQLVQKMFKSSNKKVFQEWVSLINKITKNIIKEPESEKFWWLKKSNKIIKSNLLKKPCLAIMNHLGFIDQ